MSCSNPDSQVARPPQTGSRALLHALAFSGLALATSALAQITEISVEDASVTVEETGSYMLPFMVERSGDLNDSVRLLLETATGGDNPATPGEDYTPLPAGTALLLEPGQASAQVDVEVFGQDTSADPKTLLLNIVDASATAPRFAPAALKFPICCLPRSMALADLTGNGLPDIITGNGTSLDVGVILNNGDYDLDGYLTYDVPGENSLASVHVVAGDITGNGHMDVIAVGYYSNTIALFPGDGSGTLGQPTMLSAASGQIPTGVAVADLTSNGALDIVTINGLDNSLSVLLNDGQGEFSTPQVIATGAYPYSVALADLDGDGLPDIVTGNTGDDTLSIIMNLGGGNFTQAQTHAPGPGIKPMKVYVADIDHDGIPDVLTANQGTHRGLRGLLPPGDEPGSFSILAGLGDGDLAPVQVVHVDGEFGRAQDIGVADLTGDGSLNIALTRPTTHLLTVLEQDGNGEWITMANLPTAAGPNPLAIGDVNGNGQADVLVGNIVSGLLSIFPTDGEGNVGFPGHYPAGNRPHGITSLDVNGNGVQDLAVANQRDANVSLLLNDGTGNLTDGGTLPTGVDPFWITSGDLTGNGHADLVTANAAGQNVTVMLNDGTGNFQIESYSVGSGFRSPYSVTLGDVNGDGHLDIVTANTNISADSVSVLLNDGQGAFSEAEVYATESGTHSVALLDFNGDGHIDIVAANMFSNSYSILAGDGTGSFAEAESWHSDLQPAFVKAQDINGDGHVDLVTLSHAFQHVMVKMNDGEGGFEEPLYYPIYATEHANNCDNNDDMCPWAWDMTLADITGNGYPDVITANTFIDSVSILVNDGSGTLTAPFQFITGARPGSVVATDLTGNGQMDLATANRHTNDATVLLNLQAQILVTRDQALGTIIHSVEQGEPHLSISPEIMDFGTHEVGAMVGPESVTLTNTGDGTLEVSNVSIPSGALLSAGGSCGAVPFGLAADESCTLDYMFNPLSEGTFSFVIEIESNAGPGSFELRGAASDDDGGPGPEPEVSLPGGLSVSFGEVAPGATASAEIVLHNTGGAALDVAQVNGPTEPFTWIAGAPGYPECPEAPFMLMPDAQCAWTVHFQPDAEGAYSDVFQIVSDAASSPDSVTLAGSGAGGDPGPGPGPDATPIPAIGDAGRVALILLVLLIAGIAVQTRLHAR